MGDGVAEWTWALKSPLVEAGDQLLQPRSILGPPVVFSPLSCGRVPLLEQKRHPYSNLSTGGPSIIWLPADGIQLRDSCNPGQLSGFRMDFVLVGSGPLDFLAPAPSPTQEASY